MTDDQRTDHRRDSLRQSSAKFGTVAPPVLIVDDSQVMREMLRTMLELSGQPATIIHEASDGLDAIEQLKAHNIGIMLLDLNMPRMDGLQLIEWLADHKEYSSVVVAIVSAENCARFSRQLISHGVRLIIRKPFLPEQVRDVYRNLISNYRLGIAR